MPLKGAILKDRYPKLGMREFADHDILFDASRSAGVRTIMEDRGFATVRFGTGNDNVYHKEPILNFEMHRALFGPLHDKRLYEYYRDVKCRLLGDGREKRFAPEDFYLYLVAHGRKHTLKRLRRPPRCSTSPSSTKTPSELLKSSRKAFRAHRHSAVLCHYPFLQYLVLTGKYVQQFDMFL